MGMRDDADLNALLKVIRDSVGSASTLQRKFTLDAEVTADGANFSAGERQLCGSSQSLPASQADPLVSLVRALARRCKILVLDEATSSVDLETDALIQRIIQTQLSDVTVRFMKRLDTILNALTVSSLSRSLIDSRLWPITTESSSWNKDVSSSQDPRSFCTRRPLLCSGAFVIPKYVDPLFSLKVCR